MCSGNEIFTFILSGGNINKAYSLFLRNHKPDFNDNLKLWIKEYFFGGGKFHKNLKMKDQF